MTTEAQCRVAAAHYSKTYNRQGDWSTAPRGCYINTGNNQFYFNIHITGAAALFNQQVFVAVSGGDSSCWIPPTVVRRTQASCWISFPTGCSGALQAGLTASGSASTTIATPGAWYTVNQVGSESTCTNVLAQYNQGCGKTDGKVFWGRYAPTANYCWMKMPTGCNVALSETATPSLYFVDARANSAAACMARASVYNSICGRRNAQCTFGQKPGALVYADETAKFVTLGSFENDCRYVQGKNIRTNSTFNDPVYSITVQEPSMVYLQFPEGETAINWNYNQGFANWRDGTVQNPYTVVDMADGAAFSMGVLNTYTCPPGFVHTTTQQQCQDAAAHYGKAFSSASSWTNYPPGCWQYTGSRFYFNTNAASTGTHANARPVCRHPTGGASARCNQLTDEATCMGSAEERDGNAIHYGTRYSPCVWCCGANCYPSATGTMNTYKCAPQVELKSFWGGQWNGQGKNGFGFDTCPVTATSPRKGWKTLGNGYITGEASGGFRCAPATSPANGPPGWTAIHPVTREYQVAYQPTLDACKMACQAASAWGCRFITWKARAYVDGDNCYLHQDCSTQQLVSSSDPTYVYEVPQNLPWAPHTSYDPATFEVPAGMKDLYTTSRYLGYQSKKCSTAVAPFKPTWTKSLTGRQGAYACQKACNAYPFGAGADTCVGFDLKTTDQSCVLIGGAMRTGMNAPASVAGPLATGLQTPYTATLGCVADANTFYFSRTPKVNPLFGAVTGQQSAIYKKHFAAGSTVQLYGNGGAMNGAGYKDADGTVAMNNYLVFVCPAPAPPPVKPYSCMPTFTNHNQDCVLYGYTGYGAGTCASVNRTTGMGTKGCSDSLVQYICPRTCNMTANFTDRHYQLDQNGITMAKYGRTCDQLTAQDCNSNPVFKLTCPRSCNVYPASAIQSTLPAAGLAACQDAGTLTYEKIKGEVVDATARAAARTAGAANALSQFMATCMANAAASTQTWRTYCITTGAKTNLEASLGRSVTDTELNAYLQSAAENAIYTTMTRCVPAATDGYERAYCKNTQARTQLAIMTGRLVTEVTDTILNQYIESTAKDKVGSLLSTCTAAATTQAQRDACKNVQAKTLYGTLFGQLLSEVDNTAFGAFINAMTADQVASQMNACMSQATTAAERSACSSSSATDAVAASLGKPADEVTATELNAFQDAAANAAAGDAMSNCVAAATTDAARDACRNTAKDALANSLGLTAGEVTNTALNEALDNAAAASVTSAMSACMASATTAAARTACKDSSARAAIQASLGTASVSDTDVELFLAKAAASNMANTIAACQAAGGTNCQATAGAAAAATALGKDPADVTPTDIQNLVTKGAQDKVSTQMTACMRSATTAAARTACNSNAKAAAQAALGLTSLSNADFRKMQLDAARAKIAANMKSCAQSAAGVQTALDACKAAVKAPLAAALGKAVADVSDNDVTRFIADAATKALSDQLTACAGAAGTSTTLLTACKAAASQTYAYTIGQASVSATELNKKQQEAAVSHVANQMDACMSQATTQAQRDACKATTASAALAAQLGVPAASVTTTQVNEFLEKAAKSQVKDAMKTCVDANMNDGGMTREAASAACKGDVVKAAMSKSLGKDPASVSQADVELYVQKAAVDEVANHMAACVANAVTAADRTACKGTALQDAMKASLGVSTVTAADVEEFTRNAATSAISAEMDACTSAGLLTPAQCKADAAKRAMQNSLGKAASEISNADINAFVKKAAKAQVSSKMSACTAAASTAAARLACRTGSILKDALKTTLGKTEVSSADVESFVANAAKGAVKDAMAACTASGTSVAVCQQVSAKGALASALGKSPPSTRRTTNDGVTDFDMFSFVNGAAASAVADKMEACMAAAANEFNATYQAAAAAACPAVAKAAYAAAIGASTVTDTQFAEAKTRASATAVQEGMSACVEAAVTECDAQYAVAAAAVTAAQTKLNTEIATNATVFNQPNITAATAVLTAATATLNGRDALCDASKAACSSSGLSSQNAMNGVISGVNGRRVLAVSTVNSILSFQTMRSAAAVAGKDAMLSCLSAARAVNGTTSGINGIFPRGDSYSRYPKSNN
jgi:hypothetical protein